MVGTAIDLQVFCGVVWGSQEPGFSNRPRSVHIRQGPASPGELSRA